MDALLAEYRRSPDLAAKAKATQQQYAIYLRPLDKIGHIRAKELTRRHVLTLRDAIAATRGNGAATGFVRVVSTLLTWAVDRGWIDFNPALHIRAIAAGHLPAWTVEQAARALEMLSEPLRRVVVLGMHTGQRRGDLCAMTWSAYDGSAIRLKQMKTGAALVVPVTAALRAELEAWKAERQAVTILTATSGHPWTAPHLSRTMKAAMEEAGMPGLNVHGLRKLAAANLADAGCSAHEIAAITGHASLSMVQLYTRSADQQRMAGAAVTKLETQATTRRLQKPTTSS